MPRAILTDIEGTTSSLAFVKDILFPYAAKKLPAFLRQHQNELEVAELINEISRETGTQDIEDIINILLAWIKEDRKATGLKTLQGMIWNEGYASAMLKGHVYPDAAHNLRLWHNAGIRLYIYSSGSIKAQQLLFSHTDYGNLAVLFEGFFDTHTGGKREPDSYRKIATSIGLPAEHILFLSDVCEELDAAHEAGFQTCQVLREGVPTQFCGHQQVKDFDEIESGWKNETPPD